jgi:hypothetical protein
MLSIVFLSLTFFYLLIYLFSSHFGKITKKGSLGLKFLIVVKSSFIRYWFVFKVVVVVPRSHFLK